MEDKCKFIREKILNEVKNEIKELGIEPKLAIIKCNDDNSSSVYVRNKLKTCSDVGIEATLIELNPKETNYTQLHNAIMKATNDNDSVIIQFPLCDKFKQYEKELLKIIPYYKDCDGITDKNILNLYYNNNENLILPCTVGGINELFKYHNINIESKNVVVIGRSKIVGSPMAQLMINQNATVTVCHSKTKDLKSITKKADILIVAVGKAKMINREYVKNGAIVVDVGINRDENNKLCGDCDYNDLKDICSLITPVPKGIGILTTAMVTYNVLQCFKLNKKRYENEIWKDIYYEENNKTIDYRGLYQVSNLGNVKSLKGKQKILKQADDKDGYKIVCLTKNKKHKNFKVHRLVANMFVLNDDTLNKTIINHKDENPYNNCMENLEWCDYKYNRNYGTSNNRMIENVKETLKNKDLTKDNNPFYGKHHSDKTKEILKNANSKSILQYDKNGNLIKRWSSARDASSELNINYSHISSCCIYYKNGEEWWKKNRKGTPLKYYKGFVWKFEE